MRPGVDVISRALPPPLTIPTDTSVAFMLAITDQGPAVPAMVRSLTEYVAVYGPRGSTDPTGYDAADVFFREGGNKLYVSRLNPTVNPTQLSVMGMSVPPDLEGMTRAELDTYAESVGVIDPQGLPNKDAVVAAINAQTGPVAQTLAEGPSQLAIGPTVQAALDALSSTLGPGQVFFADKAVGIVPENQGALLAHCAACNRVALLSIADGTSASMITAGHALQATANGRYGALFAPIATVPGVAPNTVRQVPWAAVQAGIIARNDSLFDPNVAAAGDNGVSLFVTSLAPAFTDLEYQNLNLAGVNMARNVYGRIEAYGYRSIVDPLTSPEWLEFGNARLNMAITAQADAIGEHYVFSQIDGRGVTIASFGSELSAMLTQHYESGALYGATPEDAFQVNVGSSVNTPASIANGELHAVILVRMAHMAEWVVIEIVKVATTVAISPTAALAA